MSQAPDWWGVENKDQYDNLIFILSSDTPEDICAFVGEPSEGLERIQIYKNVIFWTFDRQVYQKCNWWKKTAGANVYWTETAFDITLEEPCSCGVSYC